MALTPQAFVQKWANTTLNERQSYQLHFIDVCHLLNFETPQPSGKTATGKEFIFERSVKQQDGKQGYADVFLQGCFAMEYKAPDRYKTLTEAQEQLRRYHQRLQNPPLLIVTDIKNWIIETNFTNRENYELKFTNEDLLDDKIRGKLVDAFKNPDRLDPNRDVAQVTKEAAVSFQEIVKNMRSEFVGASTETVAHFLTKLVFCLFAEDIGLLPTHDGYGIFSYIIDRTVHDDSYDKFKDYVGRLFHAMNDGTEIFMEDIPYFNGSLFSDVDVIGLGRNARVKLHDASLLNWEYVEPTIFGTLFERALDPAERVPLGAHYTSSADIQLIVEPVLMQPLRREWAQIQAQAQTVRTRYDSATTGRNRADAITELTTLRDTMRQKLSTVKVLDPACGSGNFLYIALQSLLDLEQEVITYPAWQEIPEIPLVEPAVHPTQMYGIEKNAIAHALANIVVWIGYLQWKLRNGYRTITRPILQDINENIVNRDAILDKDADGKPLEPEWAAVDVIIGNPPFLGAKWMQGEMGEQYKTALWNVYDGRISHTDDLVMYWFEKARAQIALGKVKRVGLLATNTVRQGSSQQILARIKQTGDIFLAHTDRKWILEGANLRVSIIGFDDGSEEDRCLDDKAVTSINADLTAGLDLTRAKILSENAGSCFRSGEKNGSFEIAEKLAKQMLQATNASGKSNSDVVRPYLNAKDVVQNPRDMWIIDFGEMPLEEAQQYELPMQHIVTHVKPVRDRNNRKHRKDFWWQFGEVMPSMRQAVAELPRFIVTPLVAKHRIFTWFDSKAVADVRLIVIARSEDYFFGVLHSKIHECWSLAFSGTHGIGNDAVYNKNTTFETFPFPFVPGQEATMSAAYQAISAAAQCLHEERQAWLNPETQTPPQQNVGDGLRAVPQGGEVKDRTLTNLYNALVAYREQHDKQRDMPKGVKAAAWAFAPRLAALHDSLDKAVCDAYGWSHDVLGDEEAILRHLLALNLHRANPSPTAT